MTSLYLPCLCFTLQLHPSLLSPVHFESWHLSSKTQEAKDNKQHLTVQMTRKIAPVTCTRLTLRDYNLVAAHNLLACILHSLTLKRREEEKKPTQRGSKFARDERRGEKKDQQAERERGGRKRKKSEEAKKASSHHTKEEREAMSRAGVNGLNNCKVLNKLSMSQERKKERGEENKLNVQRAEKVSYQSS